MIIFDTETTGLPRANVVDLKQQPKIIEFAAIKLDDETLEEVDRMEFICNPNCVIVPKITEITGLKQEDVADKLPFKDHVPKLIKFFFGEKYLIAHNIAFDMNMMRFDLQRSGYLTKFPYPPIQICTVMSTYHINKYRMNLQKLHTYLFGEGFDGAHRAMADVEALVKVTKELVKKDLIKIA